MTKRLLSLALAVSTAFAPLAVVAQPYSDIVKTRYSVAFNYLRDKGVVKGFDDGTTRPYDTLNRAEALKMILAANEKFHPLVQWHRDHPTSLPLFSDVHSSDWYSPLVETGFSTGLLTGYPDGTFKASGTVRLAEGLAMIFRSRGITVPSSDPWYSAYMQKAQTQNLLSPAEQWKADQYLTRGEFFDLVYRSDTVRRQSLVAFVDAPVATVAYVPSTGGGYVAPAPRTYVPPRTTASSALPRTAPGSTAVPFIQFTITIPSLNITNLLVTHPQDTSAQGLLNVLHSGVGHLFSLPGTNGKILVYGHSSSYRWDVSQFTKIFRTVNQLKPGDLVYVDYAGKRYTYSVTYQEQVNPADTSRYSTPGEELILYTCWPPDTIATRLLIHAKPVTSVVKK